METSTDSTDAQAVLDAARKKKAKKADALAYLAGALQYYHDGDEDMSSEQIKEVFNNACDSAGVEDLEIE